MSYEIKKRERAIEHWGKSTFRETASIFKVSKSVLQTWKSQLNETGTLTPKKRESCWKKIDPEKLREFVSKHPDAYQNEIAEAFNVSASAIQKAMKRMKIPRKKPRNLMR